MRRRTTMMALMAVLWPALAAADDAALRQALEGRVLVYADGTRQDFAPDGTTHYGDTTGTWFLREGRYCSVWPPSDRAACYDVAVDGAQVTFTGDGGDAVTGTYAD
jgi:hypothetical protein